MKILYNALSKHSYLKYSRIELFLEHFLLLENLVLFMNKYAFHCHKHNTS